MMQIGRKRVKRVKDAISIQSLFKQAEREKQRIGNRRYHSQSSPNHKVQDSPCKLYFRSRSHSRPQGVLALELYISKEFANQEKQPDFKSHHLAHIVSRFKKVGNGRTRSKNEGETETGQGHRICRTLEIRRNMKKAEAKIEVPPTGVKTDLKKKKWSTEIGCNYAPLHSYIQQLIRGNQNLQVEAHTPKDKIITVKSMQVEDLTWAQRKRQSNIQKLNEVRKKKSLQLSSLLNTMHRPPAKHYKKGHLQSRYNPHGCGVSPWNMKETLGDGFFSGIKQ